MKLKNIQIEELIQYVMLKILKKNRSPDEITVDENRKRAEIRELKEAEEAEKRRELKLLKKVD